MINDIGAGKLEPRGSSRQLGVDLPIIRLVSDQTKPQN